jgi:hypothetical protein
MEIKRFGSRIKPIDIPPKYVLDLIKKHKSNSDCHVDASDTEWIVFPGRVPCEEVDILMSHGIAFEFKPWDMACINVLV